MGAKKMKKVTIELAEYPDCDMAFVSVDGKCVFMGNTHDFHSGCHGTKIAGYELKGLWDKGVDSLCGILKLSMEKDGKTVELVHKELSEEEYNSYMS